MNPLEFVIEGKDEASKAFESVSKSIGSMQSAMGKLKAVAGIALAATGAAAIAFAKKSVDAAEDAQTKQALLEAAYKKFPSIADVNIEAMRRLNEAIQAKTGFDDDDLAKGEAVLAQYKLTGKQIAQLTPLVADYAAKTGKDLPTAFDDVGKSMLGQGRALKDVGVNFKDTKSVAGNFAETLKGLKSTVGGTADALGKTAAGQTKILGTEFENIEETVGGLLLPVLTKMVGVLAKAAEWVQANWSVVGKLAAGLGILAGAIGAIVVAQKIWRAATVAFTAVQWAANAAMDANPIALVIIAIAALIAIIVLLATHWKQVTSFLRTVWTAALNWFKGVLSGFGKWWNNLWSGIGNWFHNMWNAELTGWRIILNAVFSWVRGVVNGFRGWWNGLWSAIGSFVSNIWNNNIVAPIRRAVNWVVSAVKSGLSLVHSVWSNIWNGLVGIVRNVFSGIYSAVAGGVNGAIGLINNMIGAFNSVAGIVHIHIGKIPKLPSSVPGFATGTNDAPGGLAIVGERGPELMNVPKHATITPNGGTATATMELGDKTISKLAGTLYKMITVQSTNVAVDVYNYAQGARAFL